MSHEPKHVIDLHALKGCLKLLPNAPSNITKGGLGCVYLKDVFDMMDNFPKEHLSEVCKGEAFKGEIVGLVDEYGYP